MNNKHLAGQKYICSAHKKSSFRTIFLRFFSISIPIFSIIMFASCASSRDFANIDMSSQQGDFYTAREQLESKKSSLYPNTDKVLYALDAGMLSHYSEDYEQSNTELAQAERLIEEYFAISITQAIGSYLLNDTVVDYAGEDFEDIYTNLFMALNYIHLGNTEAAFVEIRRFNNKLQALSAKYTDALFYARQQIASQNSGSEQSQVYGGEYENIEFYDSAFARYVSLLLYRSIGQTDSAEIDRKFIETAFQTQQQLYPFPIPNAVAQEFSIPQDKERLNVFCYTGRAPEKYEQTIQLPGIVTDTWFKLALPVMEKHFSAVSSIEIKAVDENGNETTGTLELLESIENIAVDTFQRRQGLIYLKSILRSISKTAGGEIVTTVMEEQGLSSLALLFNVATNIFIVASEQADIRSSRYFPAQVWVGGVNLDEGLYTVTVTCLDARNAVLYEKTDYDVAVSNKSVNLVEAVCLQ